MISRKLEIMSEINIKTRKIKYWKPLLKQDKHHENKSHLRVL